MVNSEKQQSTSDQKIDDVDIAGQSNGGDSMDDSSSSAMSVGASSSPLSERVREIGMEDSDGDLLLQRSDREDNVLQWLLALDMQFIGACRADERLKPLLKLNISTGAAEDRLLAHLSQHFEPAEIGMLARCLCIPLVSIRVGKINKQGSLLCPTDKRGNLNLTLLPTSDLRISFVGDDGHTERLSTLSCDSECSTVEIEGISADKSGRSFLMKIREFEVLYFWCSEKSRLLGVELLRKMKDLLKRKPSLAELTGISESRLDCFAIHLRAYLAGSSVTNAQTSFTLAASSSLDSLDSLGLNDLSTIMSLESSRSQHHANQGPESSSFNQGILSPSSSSFKEGTPRNLSSLGSVAKEKLGGRGDGYLPCFGNMTFASLSSPDMTSSSCSEKDKPPEATGSCLFPPLSSLESFGRSANPSLLHPPIQVPSSSCSPLFSPYYCLCPPVTATLPYTKSISQLPVSSAESFSLPSLSSLLSSARSSSILSSTPPFGGADFPSLDFPPLIPEPLARSQLTMPSSQQIPTFTPLMCDPIVHIPVIDVCSSGQGFLVSAGPAISTTIPPLHHNLVSPLIPEAESMVEKGARETLRWLISGSSNQPNSLMDVLPSLIINGNEKHNIFAAGSRGLYTGTKDVNAFTNGVAAMGLARLSEGPLGDGVTNRGISSDDLVDLLEEPAGSGRSILNDFPSNAREERTD